MIRLTLLTSCLVLFACDEKSDAKPAAPADKVAAGKGAPEKAAPEKTAPEKGATPTAGKIGLEAPGNVPALVALARKALTCKWEEDRFSDDCAEYKAWTGEYDAFKDNKNDATLVNFLEDPDEKVRHLGVNRLFGWNGGAFADKAMAARIVTVAEKSTAKLEAYYLGGLVGHIKVKETELFPRIKAIVTSAEKDATMRGAIVSNLLPSNPESDEVFALTKDVMKDTDRQFAGSTMNAFFMGGNSKKDQTCTVFAENLDNADENMAGAAAEKLPRFHCTAQYGALLKSIEARVKAKTVSAPAFADGLSRLCEEKDVTPAQNKQAIALAHKILEEKKNPSTYAAYVRGSAVEASVTCDAKGAKKYLAKFKKDSDKTVSQKVAKALEAK